MSLPLSFDPANHLLSVECVTNFPADTRPIDLGLRNQGANPEINAHMDPAWQQMRVEEVTPGGLA
jgi:hypothetical protein